jgi:hypothetical protein
MMVKDAVQYDIELLKALILLKIFVCGSIWSRYIQFKNI